ncbi:MAG: nucleotide pyrophosphohydrolase [Pirellulaceae bacterium]|nr:nucleotide pyrophosphohydrolase [Pirellulaceae bacterium]
MADLARSDDQNTTLAELRGLVNEFVEERDWRQFHSPKNLSMSLAIEAAELMEHFQWLDVPASREAAQDESRLGPMGEELADVLCYAIAMANELGLDIATIVKDKMAKNALKYPAAEFHGRYGSGDRKR